MRKLLTPTFLLLLACLFSPSHAWAQDCRPNVSREDKITKERIDIWTQSLFSTGFGSSLMSTSEMTIFATVGRYGTVNAVNIEIQKREESATNAAFESAFRGAVGKPFYFGFKSGDPVAFVVTEVGNDAKVQQGLFSAKGVTTVILSAIVPDNELAAMRNALTSRQIDAFRIALSGDVLIEKSLNDKNSKKLMEKFSCFYQYLDKRGIDLSAVAGPQTSASLDTSAIDTSVDYSKSAPGRYIRDGSPKDYMELKPDGAYYIEYRGQGYAGKYEVTGNIITFVLANGTASKGKLSGNTIVGSLGTWVKQDSPPTTVSQPSEVVTNEDVLRMVEAKLPDIVIVTKIKNSACKFDTSTNVLIKLKQAGVSDAVIQAMVESTRK